MKKFQVPAPPHPDLFKDGKEIDRLLGVVGCGKTAAFSGGAYERPEKKANGHGQRSGVRPAGGRRFTVIEL